MIRFYNGYTLSFGGGMNLQRGEVWTEGSRIVHVGQPVEEMPEFERQIDLKGDIIMPGFNEYKERDFSRIGSVYS